jgi:hypothetical protein
MFKGKWVKCILIFLPYKRLEYWYDQPDFNDYWQKLHFNTLKGITVLLQRS